MILEKCVRGGWSHGGLHQAAHRVVAARQHAKNASLLQKFLGSK